MKFILSGLGNWYDSWKTIEKAVTLADELGFWGAVVPDHYMWGDRGGNSTVDSWIALSHLAAKTENLKLGTLVTPIPFRPPGILAKMVATVDIISSGRAVLGVGAGWSQVEFEGYSEWNDPKTRVDKTREGVELILKLWQERSVDFHGKFFHAKGAVLEPKPVQKPHPPLLFGGFSPRMFRLAGRYGDICFIRQASWMKVPYDKAKTIVSQEARKAGRQGKITYAAGVPRLDGTSFDFKQVRQNIDEAVEAECLYYFTPFPREDFAGSMQRFAKEVIPSYSVG